jgi:hypothetical protein
MVINELQCKDVLAISLELVSNHYFVLNLLAAPQTFHTYTYLIGVGRKSLFRKQYQLMFYV